MDSYMMFGDVGTIARQAENSSDSAKAGY